MYNYLKLLGVCKISDHIFLSKTSKVYKDKKLNNTNFSNFTHIDYQIFLHLVSKIGRVDQYGKYLQPEQLQREHTLSVKEFSTLFDLPLQHSYVYLKKTVNKLLKTDLKIEKINIKEYWRINICSMAKYNTSQGTITVKFTDDIMPYLAQVREKFILYNLKEIASFRSLYTTRLYEIIQEFKDTGWFTKSIEQLREIFAVENKLSMYGDFKRKTFAQATQEINKYYDLNLFFEEIKEGRKVVAVKFMFDKTVIHQAIDNKTGKITNVYIKPKQIKKKIDKIDKRGVREKNIEKKLDGNKIKNDINEKEKNEVLIKDIKYRTKSLKSMISSFLSRFR